MHGMSHDFSMDEIEQIDKCNGEVFTVGGGAK